MEQYTLSPQGGPICGLSADDDSGAGAAHGDRVVATAGLLRALRPPLLITGTMQPARYTGRLSADLHELARGGSIDRGVE